MPSFPVLCVWASTPQASPFDWMGHKWKFVLGSASYTSHTSHCSWQPGLNRGCLLWTFPVLPYRVDVQILENSVIFISKTSAYLFLRPRNLGLAHGTGKQLSHCRSGRAAFLRLMGLL